MAESMSSLEALIKAAQFLEENGSTYALPNNCLPTVYTNNHDYIQCMVLLTVEEYRVQSFILDVMSIGNHGFLLVVGGMLTCFHECYVLVCQTDEAY